MYNFPPRIKPIYWLHRYLNKIKSRVTYHKLAVVFLENVVTDNVYFNVVDIIENKMFSIHLGRMSTDKQLENIWNKL